MLAERSSLSNVEALRFCVETDTTNDNMFIGFVAVHAHYSMLNYLPIVQTIHTSGLRTKYIIRIRK